MPSAHRSESVRAILDDLRTAGTQEEWNRKAAALVRLLCAMARGGEGDEADWRFEVGLHDLIAAGFRSRVGAPSSELQARRDARSIIASGLTDLNDAAWLLLHSDAPPAPNGSVRVYRSPPSMTQGPFRAAIGRARKAERHLGFKLTRRGRYGHPPRE